MAEDNYSGSSHSYGDHTIYANNASTRYGDLEYFNNGDVGHISGNVTYYSQSGYHSKKNGDVTYFYDQNGREVGKSMRHGDHYSYYGDCGPCTASTDK